MKEYTKMFLVGLFLIFIVLIFNATFSADNGGGGGGDVDLKWEYVDKYYVNDSVIFDFDNFEYLVYVYEADNMSNASLLSTVLLINDDEVNSSIGLYFQMVEDEILLAQLIYVSQSNYSLNCVLVGFDDDEIYITLYARGV